MDTLNSGKTLSVGDSLQSANKQYTLTLRTDGNLVLLGPPIETKLGMKEVPVLWSSGTNFPAPETPVQATMQPDGNFVLIDSSGNVVWETSTASPSHSGAYLVVQNDRNVVIYDSTPTPIWATQTSLIEHIFVLMLENRSYDHMLGHFTQEGLDAETGGTRAPDGVWRGGYSNSLGGLTFPARLGAPQRMPHDVGHGFDDVLTQLCYDPISDRDPVKVNKAWNYPPITNGGFVKNWEDIAKGWVASIEAAAVASIEAAVSAGIISEEVAASLESSIKAKIAAEIGTFSPLDPTIVMAGFGPADLPVLYTLASEFAVCDCWFSSLPGPTVPNRRFLHAASSAGLYDGLDWWPTAKEHLGGGVTFKNGTIFDKLNAVGKEYRIFQGDTLPDVQSLAGIIDDYVFDFGDIFSNFQTMVQDPSGYTPAYTFIEPNYGNDLGIAGPQDYSCGNSQHPLNDITKGEGLIKTVYETIRNSPIWESSLLIITYDEHGGFYDHVRPPRWPTCPQAVPPGDTNPDPKFAFDLLGVRVPAVVISPYIPKGTIDHRTYDHTSVLRTIEDTFMLGRLTQRDTNAKSLLPLLLLGEPRGTPSVSVTSPSLGPEPPTVVPIDPRASAPPVTLPSPANSVNPEDCSGLTDTQVLELGEDLFMLVALAAVHGLVSGHEPPQQVGQIIAQNIDRFAPNMSPQQVQEIAARISRLSSWPPELPPTVMKAAQQLVTPVDITLGNFLYVAMRREFALGGVTWDEVLDKAKRIETNWDAQSYMRKVAAQLRSKRNAPGGSTLERK